MLKAFGLLSKAGKKKIVKAGMLLALFQIVCTLPMLLIVNVMTSMIEAYRQGQTDLSGLVMYLIIGAVLITGMYFCYRVMYKAKYLNAANENMNLRMSVADKFRKLPESYLSRHDLSDLTSAVMDDIGTLEGVLTNQVAEMIGGVTATLVILAAMYFVNVKMALVLTIVVPLAFLSMSFSDLVSGKTHMRNRIAKLGISDGIQEYLENVRVLKVSGTLGKYQKGLFGKMRKLIPGLVLFEFLAGMCVSLAYNFLRIGIGIVAIAGASMLVKGEISLIVYLTFLLRAVWIYEPLSYTCEYLGAVIASNVAATRIKDIISYKEQEGNDKADVNNYDIRFDNVEFSYDKEKVLDKVSFTARQGEFTAIVGASGSGKSTILKLAARLWDYDKGSITIGGKDIKSIKPEELFKLFSIVFQDVTLFNDTIYNNILIGDQNASEDEVSEAAAYAQCMPFIERFPEGIQTVIGENGHTLSGGERQRLSIARALLKNSPVILLDESTASIDPETETKVHTAIEKLTNGRTVLMIAHRLRSIVGCDRIIVLDQGRVVGEGTHEELMNNCSIYRKLYELQCESEEKGI